MTLAAKEQSTYCAVRREGPQKIAVHIGGQKVVCPPWVARHLAGSLLRAAARLDPDFKSKP